MGTEVLVVDANREFAILIRQSLEEGGQYSVSVANSGVDALTMAAEKSFDLAVIDLDLPDIEGRKVVRRLREARPDLKLVVIPVSGPDELDEQDTLPVEKVLSKPFYLPDLPKILEETLKSSPVRSQRRTADDRDQRVTELEEEFDPGATEYPSLIPSREEASKRLVAGLASSDAQAAVLLRDRRPIAQAGEISAGTLREVAGAIPDAPSRRTTGELVRFLRLTGRSDDFLLYGAQIGARLNLALLFPADLPIGTARKQTARLAQMLIEAPSQAVEEASAADDEAVATVEEPPAAGSSDLGTLPEAPPQVVPDEPSQPEPEAEGRQAAAPEIEAPQLSEAEVPEPQPGETKAEEPEAPEAAVAEAKPPEPAGPDSAEPVAAEPTEAEPEAVTEPPEAAEAEPDQPQAPEPGTREPEPAETTPPEAREPAAPEAAPEEPEVAEIIEPESEAPGPSADEAEPTEVEPEASLPSEAELKPPDAAEAASDEPEVPEPEAVEPEIAEAEPVEVESTGVEPEAVPEPPAAAEAAAAEPEIPEAEAGPPEIVESEPTEAEPAEVEPEAVPEPPEAAKAAAAEPEVPEPEAVEPGPDPSEPSVDEAMPEDAEPGVAEAKPTEAEPTEVEPEEVPEPPEAAQAAAAEPEIPQPEALEPEPAEAGPEGEETEAPDPAVDEAVPEVAEPEVPEAERIKEKPEEVKADEAEPPGAAVDDVEPAEPVEAEATKLEPENGELPAEETEVAEAEVSEPEASDPEAEEDVSPETPPAAAEPEAMPADWLPKAQLSSAQKVLFEQWAELEPPEADPEPGELSETPREPGSADALAFPTDWIPQEEAPEGRLAFFDDLLSPRAGDAQGSGVNGEAERVPESPPAQPASYHLTFNAVLIPRFPEHELAGALAEELSQWTRRLCLAWDWRADEIRVEPQALHLQVSLIPQSAPAQAVERLMQGLSERIIERYPKMQKELPSGRFWARPYLLTAGKPPRPEQVRSFIRRTRKAQGFEV